MKDYVKQIKELRDKSFPLLRNHKIMVKRTRFFWGVRVIYFYLFSLYLIGRGAEKGLTKGGIAHELSHLEMFRKWGFWKSLWFFILQYFSKNTRRKIEAGADMYAIKKGYEKELYKTRKNSWLKASNRTKKLIKKYYLTPEEIKKHSKKV